jgi:hypothetical protein
MNTQNITNEKFSRELFETEVKISGVENTHWVYIEERKTIVTLVDGVIIKAKSGYIIIAKNISNIKCEDGCTIICGSECNIKFGSDNQLRCDSKNTINGFNGNKISALNENTIEVNNANTIDVGWYNDIVAKSAANITIQHGKVYLEEYGIVYAGNGTRIDINGNNCNLRVMDECVLNIRESNNNNSITASEWEEFNTYSSSKLVKNREIKIEKCAISEEYFL